MVITLVAALVGTSTIGFAAATSTGLIYACVNNSSGAIHIASATTTCANNEIQLVWNAEGLQGPPGPQGPKGDTGATGATGPAGTNGTNGATGATGAAGTNGTNGLDGATGATGPTGDIGAQGPSGTSGVSGFETNSFAFPVGVSGFQLMNGQGFMTPVGDCSQSCAVRVSCSPGKRAISGGYLYLDNGGTVGTTFASVGRPGNMPYFIGSRPNTLDESWIVNYAVAPPYVSGAMIVVSVRCATVGP